MKKITFLIVIFISTIVSAQEMDLYDDANNPIADGSTDSPQVSNNTEFGDVLKNASLVKTFTIVNSHSGGGNGKLNISDFSFVSNPSGYFSISNTSTPYSINKNGGTSTFTITFSPTAVGGPYSAEVSISSDDADENPYTFTVQGSAIPSPADIDIQADGGSITDGGSFDFGDVGPASSIVKLFTIENTGDEDLTNVSAVSLTTGAEFTIKTQVAGAPLTLMAGETTTFELEFTPSGFGSFTDTVTITSDDADEGTYNFTIDASKLATDAVRGPYLNSGTATSVVVKWRTNIDAPSTVYYGETLGNLLDFETDNTLKTDHEITITGLTPDTKYFYEIRDGVDTYIPESIEMYYTTAPVTGTDTFVRAWILGDAGTATTNQRNVRDAYYDYVSTTGTNTNQTDLMLFLGDNAYNSGYDAEYQLAFFDIYTDMLKKSGSWSCLGNHDGYQADSATQSGPYYDIFTFPTDSGAGGMASGTEAYYSFDYANIHFIILDSYETSRAVNDPMYTWAQSDIQNTTQDWIVVLFHHPPYTKGSHDSDTETNLIQMRQNFMPMLEANGTDLVLSGHSHSYERSYFLNGHHGLSSSFNEIAGDGINDSEPLHIVGANGNGDGSISGDGAYVKTSVQNEGAVYITTGSAGKVTGTLTSHNAMYASLYQLGSGVLEIEDDGSGGQNLTVKFLTDSGAITDEFTINKTGTTLSVNKETSSSVKLFPVPANNLLNIKVNPGETLQSMKFYNVVGKLVRETNKEQVNVSTLKTGMYLVQIKTDKNEYYKNIIIE